MTCPIKPVSKDCDECNGKSTTWYDVAHNLHECVFVTVAKARFHVKTLRDLKVASERFIKERSKK